MHEENFLGSWLRQDVEGKEEERKMVNKEIKEEESKRGTREVEGERERAETERNFWLGCPAKFSRCLVPLRRWRVLGIPLVFRCVCACCASVCACEVVLSDSDCEFVEPQAFSLSRKREACFVESQETVNFDGAPVKAPPATSRKATPPTP